MPVTILGNGRLGHALNRALSLSRPTAILSARSILRGETTALEAALAGGGTLILAHGENVNVPNFARRYDRILSSRLLPMEVAARFAKHIDRVILVSSTIAAGKGHAHSLPALQRAYEDKFEALFSDVTRVILRVGTLAGPGSQLADGLVALRRTFVFRRLRTSEATNLPWADFDLVQASANEALSITTPAKWVVAYRKGLSLNSILDETHSGRTITLSKTVFAWAWRMLGVHPELLAADVSSIEGDGWALVPLPDNVLSGVSGT